MTDWLFPDEDGGCSKLEREFLQFHEENPAVYRLICRFANEAIAAGRSRLSINMLFERIRWYTRVETRAADRLKLNNNHRAFYARLWLRDHPDRPGLFETRVQRSA